MFVDDDVENIDKLLDIVKSLKCKKKKDLKEILHKKKEEINKLNYYDVRNFYIDNKNSESEKIFLENLLYMYQDKDIHAYYEKYYTKKRPKEAGNVISRRTFWIDGENIYDEEPEKIVDSNVYTYGDLIINQKGGVEKITESYYDEVYFTKRNNCYKKPLAKISRCGVKGSEFIHPVNEGCVTALRGSFTYKIEVILKDNDILQIKEFKRDFAVYKRQKQYLKTKHFYQMSLNLKTGRNYEFGPTNRCDSTLTQKDLRLKGYDKFRYTEFKDIPKEIEDYIVSIIAQYKSKTLGFKPTFYKNCFNSYEAFAAFNSSPLCCPAEYLRAESTTTTSINFIKIQTRLAITYLQFLG